MTTEEQCQKFIAGYFGRNRQIAPSIYYTVHPSHLIAEQTALEDPDKWFMEDCQDLTTGELNEYLEGPFLLLPDNVEVRGNCEPVVEIREPQDQFDMQFFMINEETEFGFLVVRDLHGNLHVANFMGG